jgi:hypothetical protein
MATRGLAASAIRPRARALEVPALAAAWAALLALFAARGPLTFQGVLGVPLLSVTAAVLALWVAPGYVLWRARRGTHPPGRSAWAWAGPW